MRIRLCETPRARRRAARERASEVLHLAENRATLVLACIASAVVSFASYFVAWAFALAVSELSCEDGFVLWLFTQLLTVVLLLLLAMPLWLGTYRLALRMVDARSFGMEDYFYYIKNSATYTRALGISARLLVRWIPAILGFWVLQLFFDYDLVGLLLACFFAVTVLLSLVFVGRLCGFVTMAIADSSLSLGKAQQRGAVIASGEQMSTLRFHFGMAWRMLLSLLLAGVPLILHTLPSSMLATACYVRRLSARDDILY
ncbi:MAG: hypothetical protein E7606_02740 [Ruminococcaceae bacterium]|nr:hypothetical protein [Oscillospiraceae bacterium]